MDVIFEQPLMQILFFTHHKLCVQIEDVNGDLIDIETSLLAAIKTCKSQ